jgi:hypothetical protein
MGQAQALADPEPNSSSASIIDPRTAAPWAESAVYVVMMDGHFTLTQVTVPKGVPDPTGTVMTLMIDRESGDVVGLQLGTEAGDLHRLGSAVTTWTGQ